MFVAGLWAVHPVLTESITNIIGRVDLLAGMAVLSGLLFYLQSDPSCEVVHRHLCEGSIGAEQIYTQAGRADLAATTRDLAAQKLRCGP